LLRMLVEACGSFWHLIAALVSTRIPLTCTE
jgi:hypothetical protein